jgi:uncharacterized phage protein gp47/JayE
MPFSRPTLEQLIARTSTDISSRLGIGPLLARSTLGVLARVLAGASHQLYGYLDWIARQVMPDTAELEHLERWSSIWGIQRKAASFALGNITFTGTNGTVIPAGTRLQRGDGAQFDTTADATIASGTATAAVTAVLAGAAGNTAAAIGLTLVSPISGVTSAATVAAGGLTAGADTESDNSLRARLLDRIRQAPHGGAAFDYVKWALEVAGVTRAWSYASYLGPGTVGVAIVTDDAVGGPIPSPTVVAAVQAYIEERRPVTAQVTVFAPVAKPLNLTIALTPNSAAVKDAVEAELVDLLKRDAVPGGTILLSRIREAVSIAAGESDNTVTNPTANFTCATGELATLGTITWA